MGVVPVRSEEDARPQLAQDAGQTGTGFERRFQPAIGQPQVAAPGQAQNRGRRLGFPLANLRAAEGGRFAVGQIEDADPRPCACSSGIVPPTPNSASSG